MRLKLHLAHFDIMEVVEEVCADLPIVGQPVLIKGKALTGCWCRVSMKRVLENLASNALKYGDHLHPVTVRVSRVDDRMLLSVHNEGKPIPKPDIPRLFHTFQRIEDVDVKGWGLGLPFVQNAIESHGGSVVVDSAEGRGTTFTLTVPIDARPYVTG
jgi:signal transduction histidine kinase